ncbi:ABC transporter permease [Bacillaceae bacterium SAOS 7]|nr:ABC transporter permease [Bacillaceae bacterium SAOS 7]
MLSALLSLTKKDALQSFRNPLFFIISILVPLIFVSLYAFMVHVSTTNPIVVANHSEGKYSDRLLEIMETMGVADGKYYDIKTVEPEKAYHLYKTNQAVALLDIPANFDENLANGKHGTLDLQVMNINSDDVKNFQIRLDHAIYLYQQKYHPNESIHMIEYQAFEEDIPIKHYLAAALLMFTVLYSGMVNTGVLLTKEWEERTAKPLVLSPLGYAPLIASKWLTAFIQTIVSTGITLWVLNLLLGFPISQLNGLVWLNLLLLFIYSAAIGTLLGVSFQQSLPLIPISVIIAVGHFFVNGYESYIRGFAHNNAVEWLWKAVGWFPISSLTDYIRFTAESINSPYPWISFAAMCIIIFFLLLFAAYQLHRNLSFTQGQ